MGSFLAVGGLLSSYGAGAQEMGRVGLPHSMWNLGFLDQQSNLCPLHWELGVLATRPLGKSLGIFNALCLGMPSILCH